MTTQSLIRWIIFDAVGTLLTPSPTVAEAYAAVGQRWGSALTVEQIRPRFRAVFRESESACFPPERIGRTSEREERTRWRWIVRHVLDDVTEVESCFQELWQHFAEPSSWHVYPDVELTLHELRERGYRLAIASNFDARLHRLCEKSPGLSLLEHRFVSSELGHRKPAAAFYDTVQRACQAESSALLMVGDDPDCDITGPLRAGWSALLIDRCGSSGALPDLRALLDRLDASSTKASRGM